MLNEEISLSLNYSIFTLLCAFVPVDVLAVFYVSFSGCVRMVKGEGMPQYRNPFEKGDLYVKFDVQFPENNWIDAEKLNVSYPTVTFAEM